MKLTLPTGPFKAYLFDCDGTIADSMPLHYVAWKQALGEWGAEFPEPTFYAWGGMPTVQIVETLAAQQGLTLPAEQVAHRKELLYYELLPQLRAVPEVLEHIDLSHGHIPFAVVSGGSRQSVTNSLTTLGILNRFDTLVCSEDYTKRGAVPGGGPAAGRCARGLPRLRGHRDGHSGGNGRGHGEREDPAALGTEDSC
jgi:beta-phosphoglucomutase-like phosphatase (HAD superfamily)